jgi:hypothetical protein
MKLDDKLKVELTVEDWNGILQVVKNQFYILNELNQIYNLNIQDRLNYNVGLYKNFEKALKTAQEKYENH